MHIIYDIFPNYNRQTVILHKTIEKSIPSQRCNTGSAAKRQFEKRHDMEKHFINRYCITLPFCTII